MEGTKSGPENKAAVESPQDHATTVLDEDQIRNSTESQQCFD